MLLFLVFSVFLFFNVEARLRLKDPIANRKWENRISISAWQVGYKTDMLVDNFGFAIKDTWTMKYEEYIREGG